jgi:hypothetical protein
VNGNEDATFDKGAVLGPSSNIIVERVGVDGCVCESSPPYSVVSSHMGNASQSASDLVVVRRAVGRLEGIWDRTGSERDRVG